jgi:hypothetical protein
MAQAAPEYERRAQARRSATDDDSIKSRFHKWPAPIVSRRIRA